MPVTLSAVEGSGVRGAGLMAGWLRFLGCARNDMRACARNDMRACARFDMEVFGLTWGCSAWLWLPTPPRGVAGVPARDAVTWRGMSERNGHGGQGRHARHPPPREPSSPTPFGDPSRASSVIRHSCVSVGLYPMRRRGLAMISSSLDCIPLTALDNPST